MVLRIVLPNLFSDLVTKTPLACRVPDLVHDSCTACIVGVARANSATTSDSTIAHPVDSSWDPPDARVIARAGSGSHSEVELWRSRTGKGSSGGRKKGVV